MTTLYLNVGTGERWSCRRCAWSEKSTACHRFKTSKTLHGFTRCGAWSLQFLLTNKNAVVIYIYITM